MQMTLTEPPNLALPVTTPNQIAVSNVKHVAPGNSKLFCYQKIVMKSERRDLVWFWGDFMTCQVPINSKSIALRGRTISDRI